MLTPEASSLAGPGPPWADMPSTAQCCNAPLCLTTRRERCRGSSAFRFTDSLRVFQSVAKMPARSASSRSVSRALPNRLVSCRRLLAPALLANNLDRVAARLRGGLRHEPSRAHVEAHLGARVVPGLFLDEHAVVLHAHHSCAVSLEPCNLRLPRCRFSLLQQV